MFSYCFTGPGLSTASSPVMELVTVRWGGAGSKSLVTLDTAPSTDPKLDWARVARRRWHRSFWWEHGLHPAVKPHYESAGVEKVTRRVWWWWGVFVKEMKWSFSLYMHRSRAVKESWLISKGSEFTQTDKNNFGNTLKFQWKAARK